VTSGNGIIGSNN